MLQASLGYGAGAGLEQNKTKHKHTTLGGSLVGQLVGWAGPSRGYEAPSYPTTRGGVLLQKYHYAGVGDLAQW